MIFIIFSMIQTGLVFMNTIELIVKWRLARGLEWLAQALTGVKPPPTPFTKPLR